MISQLDTKTKKSSDKSSFSNATSQTSAFNPRPFVTQAKSANDTDKSDLKTSLQRAEKYGHNPSQIQSANTSSKAIPMQPKMGVEGRKNQHPIQFMLGKMTGDKLKGSRNPPWIKSGKSESSKAPLQNPDQAPLAQDLGEENKPIPQNMHFFWSGDTPGRTGKGKEFENLKKWGQQNNNTKENRWDMNLWTDQGSYDKWTKEDAPDDIKNQMKELRGMGINIQKVEDQIHEKNKHVYDHGIKNNAPTMASDVARYNVLHNHGGIYADLDLAPKKNFQFPSGDALESGKLPFVGPRIQDETALKDPKTEEKRPIDEVVNEKYQEGLFNNNLIAAEKGNKTMGKAIDKIGEIQNPIGSNLSNYDPTKKYLENDTQKLKTDASRFTGPEMLGKVMAEQMGNKSAFGEAKGAFDKMNDPLAKTLGENINLLTEASNDKGEGASYDPTELSSNFEGKGKSPLK